MPPIKNSSTEEVPSNTSSAHDSESDHKSTETVPADFHELSLQSDAVDFDGPNDPAHPRQWSESKKWTNLIAIVILNVLTPLASSIPAPAVPAILAEFHNDSDILSEFIVSAYILGYAVGTLLCAPASELYGRWPVYVVCNFLFLVFTMACALSQSLTQLIVFRFFAGTAGVCPIILGGASIGDMIEQEKRGLPTTLWSMGALLAPVLGPIIGSFLAAAEGWRWIFWLMLILSGAATIFHALATRETHIPTILYRKTQQLRKQTGNPTLYPAIQDPRPVRTRLTQAIVRPYKVMIRSPVVGLMTLYCAIIYGILYLLYTTISSVYADVYHWSAEDTGLAYIGMGIGLSLGMIVLAISSDRILLRMASRNGGEKKAEYRLIPLLFTSWMTPAGLFLYGWTIQYREQWAVPLVGTILIGFGVIPANICTVQYMVDASSQYTASVVAANGHVRAIVGGLLPLAGLRMYDALGWGWGNSLIAFVALAMIPVVFFFYFRGERIRKSSKMQL